MSDRRRAFPVPLARLDKPRDRDLEGRIAIAAVFAFYVLAGVAVLLILGLGTGPEPSPSPSRAPVPHSDPGTIGALLQCGTNAAPVPPYRCGGQVLDPAFHVEADKQPPNGR